MGRCHVDLHRRAELLWLAGLSFCLTSLLRGEGIIFMFLVILIFHLRWICNCWVSTSDPRQLCFSELLRDMSSVILFNKILKVIDACIKISHLVGIQDDSHLDAVKSHTLSPFLKILHLEAGINA